MGLLVKVDNKILNNRYKLKNQIGLGGMAIVYKAIDLKLNRSVAIKILKNELIEKGAFLKRFQIEAQSVASLSHSNIVPIYDIGDNENIHYIVMEYVNGKSLKELISDEKILSIDKIINIFIQMCRAFNHAHENDIIHRDIKPHNILISKKDIVKITDFGIAKVASQTTLTQAGSFMGSVHYFSPEQAKSETADIRSDIYSLGITLYEMITGNVPFNGDNLISIVMKHINATPDYSNDRFNHLPKGIKKILQNMLQKNPDDRYQNIKDLMIDFYSVIRLDSDPITNKYIIVNNSPAKTSVIPNKNNTSTNSETLSHTSETVVISDVNNKENVSPKSEKSNIASVKIETTAELKNKISTKGKNEFIKIVKSVIPQVSTKLFDSNTQQINYKILESYEIINVFNNKIYSGLSNGLIKVWDINSKQCIKTITASEYPIKILSLNSKIIASSSANQNKIKLWDIESGNLINTLDGHLEAIKSIAMNEEILVSGSKDGIIKVWNLKNGLCRGSLNAHTCYIKCLLLKNRRIVSGGSDGTIKIWNSGDGSCEKQFFTSKEKIVSHLDSIDRLVYNNNTLISATKTGKIKYWDINKQKISHEFKSNYNISIENMDLYKNKLITVSFDGSIREWNIKKGVCINTYQDKFFVNSVSIKNNIIATVSKEGIIKIWDINSRKVISIINTK
jgi:serine/threonine protein kinase